MNTVLFPFQHLLVLGKVELKIVEEAHFDSLQSLALTASDWKYFTSNLADKAGFKAWFTEGIGLYKEHKRIPFAIFNQGEMAGTTSFGNISLHDKRIEIGWTWLGKKHQGTGLNPKVKLLLLSFAFEQLGMERVELKTDVNNLASRKAMLKIGATEEGILRSHTLMAFGNRRDTIYYSILKTEWPSVKERLLNLIDAKK